MEHNFETLSSVLSRCSAKVAEQVIAEVRSALNEANHGSTIPESRLSKMAFAMRKAKAERAAERREKAAARRAAKKAEKEAAKAEASAERSESPQSAPVAVASPLAAGSAEAQSPSPSGEGRGGAVVRAGAFTHKMVKFLRQCTAPQMLLVLNSYTNLLLTGSPSHCPDTTDQQFIDNFIYLANLEGTIDSDQEPTLDQTASFFFDNPALPLPRAERRRLQRLARKHKLPK